EVVPIVWIARRIDQESDHADLDIVPGTRGPEPGMIPPDRATELDAEVLDVLDWIARAGVLPPQLVGDVLRLELVIRDVEAAAALERVTAALRDQVDGDAARLLRRVAAAGVDGHLLERIEVVVGRRRVRRCVGDRSAIHRPQLPVGAVSAEPR